MGLNNYRKEKKKSATGYSLLEMLVVLVILGILATQVVQMFSSLGSKVKGAAFNLRNDLNLARSESVNNNLNVIVSFVFDSGGQDGYDICLDADDDDVCDVGEEIKSVLFDPTVQFYDPPDLASVPTNGPTLTPGGASVIGGTGVIFGGATQFVMRPDGTSNIAGSIVIYAPDSDTPNEMSAPPIAVIVGSTTGRIRLERWNTDLAVPAWVTR